jgi:hypothetical protein
MNEYSLQLYGPNESVKSKNKSYLIAKIHILNNIFNILCNFI